MYCRCSDTLLWWLNVADAEENTGSRCCWSWSTYTCCRQVSPGISSVVSSSDFCMWPASINDCCGVFQLLWVQQYKESARCFLWRSTSSVCISFTVVVRSEEKEAWFVLYILKLILKQCTKCFFSTDQWFSTRMKSVVFTNEVVFSYQWYSN